MLFPGFLLMYILDTERDSGIDDITFYFLFNSVIDSLFSHADQNTSAFKEVAIIRHPRLGEYAFGFITSSVVLQVDTLLVQVDFCT